MSTYAIGDIQGCYYHLMHLLEQIKFDPSEDKLWFVGDLVNRGPKSLKTLRFVKSLGDSAVTVLGNHDLHLLAHACGHPKLKRPEPKLKEILKAEDSDELIYWLRHRNIMFSDDKLKFHLVHAGIYPLWKIKRAQKQAHKLEQVLKSDNYAEFILNMYGNHPKLWHKDLKAMDDLRFTVNCFTRMRFVHESGRLDFHYKADVGKQPKKISAWFTYANRKSKKEKIVFGHWSSLNRTINGNTYCLDSGCVWKGKLTALRLESPSELIQIDCKKTKPKMKSRNHK